MLAIYRNYKELSNSECNKINRGHLIGEVLGAIGHVYHPADPQKVLDQLNGKTQPKPGHQYSPYGYY
ncbi:hypothetical protein FEZ47_09690 [Leuconostoc mesenteroides]|uniref:hypothetical protein n=1 Tax=Leuconostoc mesenteroides TaxID=1245 RepID=UPI000682BBCB|nr:hypothetical protein [Leuconostoc mesenteroides]ARR90014.1 hypothetical protein BSR26_09905 [Leuconostoc mesenteroides subsp. mesenteroides]KMY77284.1 hypothetical protein WZ81_09635 [Leuconostoc mesenteroides subsp. cremoris]ORI76459.1 hypothetical protein BMS90_09945 [Leuconostoc mesenteroides subsp. mesenteroides]TLP92897.1 hypothetical protein FEZ47_09690 [Leuconostoc mesenteroides]